MSFAGIHMMSLYAAAHNEHNLEQLVKSHRSAVYFLLLAKTRMGLLVPVCSMLHKQGL